MNKCLAQSVFMFNPFFTLILLIIRNLVSPPEITGGLGECASIQKTQLYGTFRPEEIELI